MRFSTSSMGGGAHTRSSAGSDFLEESFMVDEFCAALGRFVMEFARAEQMVKDLLVNYAKLSAPTGRAVLDGLRMKPVIGKIRRVHEAEGLTLHPRLVEGFAQLMNILDMRDKILHQGFEFDLDGVRVTTTNWSTAHLDKNVYTQDLSVALLENMIADLRRIQLYMIYWGPDEPLGLDISASLQELAAEPQPPWLYKPQQPKDSPQKNRGTVP
jgi:hypothetical protein